MTDSFEDRYTDVLQNIEFAIVGVYQEHPELADSNVDRVLEGLIRTYNAESNRRSAPTLKLAELDQALFDRVRAMCEWRLGRDGGPQTEEGAIISPEPITPDEIIACLKRIRVSVKRWTTQGGRQGYLKFVSPFLGVAQNTEVEQNADSKTSPAYPYNKRTDTITLPPDIEQEMRQLVLNGGKIEAMKRVMRLTGAGLKVSKDYLDGLERK